jgi:phosphatidylglycerol:prolipoprotein diacylglycerol transferase
VDPCSLPTCLKIGVDPIALHLGSFALYWYGLLVALGFIIAIRVGSREAEKVGLNADQLLSATLVGALFGLLTARVFYVLQNQPQYYVDGKHLGEALSLWQGGLTFYGGIFGAILGVWLYTGRYNLPLLRFLDIGALVAPLGQAIGRVGNVINGDIIGINTHNFGIEYTSGNNLLLPTDQVGKAQHPVAVYDMFWEAALFAALFYLWRRRILRPGQAAGVYLFGFSAGQLLIGGFRAAPVGQFGLKANQLTALPILAAGLWLFLRSTRGGATYSEAPIEPVAVRKPRPRRPAGTAVRRTAGATGAAKVAAPRARRAAAAPAKKSTRRPQAKGG